MLCCFRTSLLLPVLLCSSALAAELKPPQAVKQEVKGSINRPGGMQPTEENISKHVKVPAGFSLTRFADKLGNARIIAVGEDGSVYVTRRNEGDVLLLKDADGDGKADLRKTVAKKEGMHGIALHGKTAYLATVKEVYIADIGADGTLSELKQIIGDLPDGGQHPNRTLAIGPDGMLYISVGSSCNACDETNKEHATILQAKADGSSRKVFASGLRNTIGFAWHPQTKQMFGLDHGIDWLGDDGNPEELNVLEDGKKYGWPYVYADGQLNRQKEPKGITLEQWRDETTNPVLMYTAHAAPMQLVLYTAEQFPQEFRTDAFATMRGSWNRDPPSGYEVVRIRFEGGKPAKIEPVVTGFLVKNEDGSYSHLGRLCGLALAKDGSLLFGDDANGVIYRVRAEKQAAGN